MSIATKFFKQDYQVLAFAIIGILLLLIPDTLIDVFPYLIGVALVIYGGINVFVSKIYPDSEVSLGEAIIKVILGIVILVQKEKSVSTIGVIWAISSLYEVAEKIEGIRKDRKVRIISVVGIVIATILAAVLLLDPFEHFNAHVRILGIEMIITSFLQYRQVSRDGSR